MKVRTVLICKSVNMYVGSVGVCGSAGSDMSIAVAGANKWWRASLRDRCRVDHREKDRLKQVRCIVSMLVCTA